MKEIVRYLIFGVLTTMISILSFEIFLELCSLPVLIANICSWILSVGFAYVTNRVWVFGSEARGLCLLLREVISFFAGRLATLFLEEAILLLFVTLAGFPAAAVKIGAQALVIITNYIISKFWIFHKKKENLQ